MDWIATYDDFSQYSSKDYQWKDLPKEGFIKLMITLPTGGKMQVSGWDFYSLKEIEGGIRISYWKDTIANDINGEPIEEPYLNKGSYREFYNDGSANSIEYYDASVIYNGIPNEEIKNGIWVDDDTAKLMGVL